MRHPIFRVESFEIVAPYTLRICSTTPPFKRSIFAQSLPGNSMAPSGMFLGSIRFASTQRFTL